jgi:uncharacterized protein YraI
MSDEQQADKSSRLLAVAGPSRHRCGLKGRPGRIGTLRRLGATLVALSVTFGLGALVTIATPTAHAAPRDGVVVGEQAQVVNSPILHLRSGPGLGYAIILTMHRGDVVTVLAGPYSADDYEWYHVNYHGRDGWAVASWLAPVRPTSIDVYPQDGFAPGHHARVVNTGSLHMRTGPGLGYPIVLVLPEGADVEIEQGPDYATGYTWYCVLYQGTRGYSAAPWLAPYQASPGDNATPLVAQAPSGGYAAPPAHSFAPGSTARVENYPILHMRTGPGLGYPIVVTIPEGATVTIEVGPEYGSGYTWYGVVYDGMHGYSAAPWLAPN